MSSFGIADGVLRRADQVADALHLGPETPGTARELLTGRVALLGLTAPGRVSAGGGTHLLSAADGWCALTLSRPDDVAAVPALVESDDTADDPWPAVHGWAAGHTVEHVTERAWLLDLPASALGETPATPPRVIGCGTAAHARSVVGLLVVDMTSMWAGPLCGQLLARAGAVVVKVESPGRPDGTRAGDRAFYDWMNSGKLSYAVDFEQDAGALRALLAAADIVLEGSRPVALARRGLGPHDCPPQPGRVWCRITGYGTDGRDAQRVAFGDDAAVAGGLVGRDGAGPVFCGDAIADPLTGLAAAEAVVQAVAKGGGLLVEVSMAAVAASYAALPAEPVVAVDAVAPAARPPAAALGRDNAAVHHLVAERHSAAC